MHTKEGLTISGKVTLRSYPAGTLDCYQALIKLGKLDLARQLLADGKIEAENHNLIVDASNYGIDILVQYLISGYTGTNPFPLGIQWGEIGTGTTTPANTDIALTSPTNRSPVIYAFDNSFTTAAIQFFFADGILANGTYYECGTFFNGTSTIGTGNMFNHALFDTPYVKTTGVDTTLEVDITIANS
jgi:hypothetical protein